MSSAFRIAISNENETMPITILVLSGDLDGKTYKELEAKAGEVITGGASNLVIDLGGVNYMGSAGLRALYGITNQIKTAGPEGTPGQVKFVKPSEAVSRVIFTLGFDKYFTIYEDLQTAINAF
jgi:anti-anti-sigma factor